MRLKQLYHRNSMLVTQKRRISAGQTSATRRFSIAPALSLTQQGVVNHQAIVMSSRSSNALFLFDTLLRTQSVVFVDSVDSSTAKSIHYRKRRATEEAWAALGQKQPQVAHTLLTKEEGLIDEISPPIIYELVSQLVATEADKSLMVIPHYIAACSRRDLKPVGLMKILDQVCRYIHTMKTPHHDRICKNLQAIFSSLGPVARRACFERMLLGLLHQREHNGFLLASKLYMSSNHELLSNPNFLTSLLHTSTFQSASKFPFVDVLERLTRLDQALLPSSSVSLLQLFIPTPIRGCHTVFSDASLTSANRQAWNKAYVVLIRQHWKLLHLLLFAQVTCNWGFVCGSISK